MNQHVHYSCHFLIRNSCSITWFCFCNYNEMFFSYHLWAQRLVVFTAQIKLPQCTLFSLLCQSPKKLLSMCESVTNPIPSFSFVCPLVGFSWSYFIFFTIWVVASGWKKMSQLSYPQFQCAIMGVLISQVSLRSNYCLCLIWLLACDCH